MERRLSAIFAADMVDYSRLMEADEAGTLARQKAYRRELINPALEEFSGRVVKEMGDGFLVEFPSVVNAVTCALAIQRAVPQRELMIQEDKRIAYRVGINLGDVVVESGDLFGDGVNVASRLEQLSEPGGICISGTAYDQIEGRSEFSCIFLGEQKLKNISRPIRTYSVAVSAAELDTPSPANPALPEKPSIAVLPFENMSGDPDQEYFADGIAEEIITALSRFQWFFVISRSSSFAYRGKFEDTKKVAQELGVRYVLEGSVRRSGSRVRITTQLIDALANHHVWAERFDRDLEDIFAVQDEITQKIIASVAPGIISAEMQRSHHKDIASLDAWERVMRAHWHLSRFTMEDNVAARRLLTEAAQIDPNSSLALGDFAMIHVFDAQWGWGFSRDQSLAAAAEAARRAVDIDDGNAWAHIALGLVELFALRHSAAIRRFERAIEISPNEPNAHGHLGFALAFSGETTAAIAETDEAMRLSPRDPFFAFWCSARALAEFSAGNYREVIEWATRIIQEKPQHPGAYRLLAASYAQLGDTGNAKIALEQMLVVMPGITLSATREQVPWKKADDAQRYIDGLRAAGLPE